MTGTAEQLLYTSPWHVPDIASCCWYHSLDLPEGTVRGQWDLRGRFSHYVGHVPLGGRRVLDIGTASGFLTWEAEKRGAEVVSFDLDHARRQKLLPFASSVYMRDRAESERQRNEYEDALLVRLRAAVPEAVRVTILADRGFGDQKLYTFLRELRRGRRRGGGARPLI